MTENIYCSVDLEFTGFDPSRDQILELGFAFFRMTETGAEILEEWSQVFQPSIDVPPKILGLTGITQRELDAAPKFSEHREFIQSKLRDVTLVAHNPLMDVKFLESYGITLSGKVIDTLELVQFLLPTHHSYNLENLMHYFGIAHSEAHRALGDCKTTIAVLEHLLRIYQSFNADLKNKLTKVISRGQFEWQSLLSVPLKPLNFQLNDSLRQNDLLSLEPKVLDAGLITVDDRTVDHEARVALGLRGRKSLLVIPDNQTVMRLWKSGLVHGLFSTEDVFSPQAFEKFLAQANSNEELRFCLKVLVWQELNWQREVVLDLNISFFGGQFKSFIVGGTQELGDHDVLCCDYRSLNFVTKNLDLADREAVICNLQEFESFVSGSGPNRLSWNSLLYSLKVIYNPETDFGDMSVKDLVIESLAATDLFFALVYMLLHRAYPHQLYVPVPQLGMEQPHIFRRLSRSAELLRDKLQLVEQKTGSTLLEQYTSFLGEFFAERPERVRWVTVDEHNLAFHDQPLEISSLAQAMLKGFQTVRYTDTVSNRDLLFYLAARLGLNTEQSDFPNKTELSKNFKLFLGKNTLPPSELVERIKESAKPCVAVMQSPADIKDLYNKHYEDIKTTGALFAQGYSGGGNKMFRNFSIRSESILLATADFIARQPHILSPRTVIIQGPPELEAAHPYIAALLKHYPQLPQLKQIFVTAKIAACLKKLAAAEATDVYLHGMGGEEELQKLLTGNDNVDNQLLN